MEITDIGRLHVGDRAQTWHDPKDVERALDVSLGDLQLDYGDFNDDAVKRIQHADLSLPYS
jgi:hypothetical protein